MGLRIEVPARRNEACAGDIARIERRIVGVARPGEGARTAVEIRARLHRIGRVNGCGNADRDAADRPAAHQRSIRSDVLKPVGEQYGGGRRYPAAYQGKNRYPEGV